MIPVKRNELTYFAIYASDQMDHNSKQSFLRTLNLIILLRWLAIVDRNHVTSQASIHLPYLLLLLRTIKNTTRKQILFNAWKPRIASSYSIDNFVFL